MSNLKSIARAQAFKKRAIAHSQICPDITAAVLTACQNHQIIAAYMPMRTEIDALPAMHALHNKGKQVCVPVIVAKNSPLKFVEWTPDCDMTMGEFGALIPAVQIPLTPDLILAPLVAYDATGTRLGYGGGFYDRTLACYNDRTLALNPVPLIGLAFSAQELETLPFEATDMKLNAVITEHGLRNFT